MSPRRRHRLGRALATATVLLAAAPQAAASPAAALAASPPPPAVAPSPNPADHAGEPWWLRVPALGTRRVTLVSVDAAGTLTVTADGARLRSGDGARTFAAAAAAPPAPPPSSTVEVDSRGERWVLRAGRVLRATRGGALRPDPRAPDLGAGARLIAVPASLEGVVLAVSTSGIVWRRGGDGDWSRSLVLLPRGLFSGAPPITAIAAFTAPVTDAVYVGTEGYSVLETGDAGTDWIRAGPGLPDDVLGLAADAHGQALWAATSGGLYVHHLRPLPHIPVYPAPERTRRWLEFLLITVAAGGAAVAALWWLMAHPPRRLRAGVR